MTHKLKVHLAPVIPDDPGIVAAQTKTLRERALRWLLGVKHPITILVPGNSVRLVRPGYLTLSKTVTTSTAKPPPGCLVCR